LCGGGGSIEFLINFWCKDSFDSHKVEIVILFIFVIPQQIDITKKARNRGPSGAVLWGVSCSLIAFGFYRIGQGNKERSGEFMAEREARYAMAPVLQAEEDRWYLAREKYILEQEAEIMKDVPGWVVGESVYFGKRWVPRQTMMMDSNFKK